MAFSSAEKLIVEFRIPVVIECTLEPVTNISIGLERNCINEFEEILCLDESLSAESGWVADPKKS